MARDPAMLLYTSDFLTGTALLNMRERGQYITLLCLQQQCGHMSLQQMQQAVGKLSPAVLGKYVLDDDGLYYNARADLEIAKRKAHCEKQRKNIEKRWSNTEKDASSAPSESYHGITVEHTTVIPLENEIYKQPKVSTKRDEEFIHFWSVYPRKIGKAAARKAFDKVPADALPKIVPAVEAQKKSYQWQRDGGQFIPHPATWLNQGRWDDEVDSVKPAPTNKKVVTAAEYTAPAKKIDFEALKKAVQDIEGPS